MVAVGACLNHVLARRVCVGQSASASDDRLLDGADVVISLVPGECCFSRKRLLAVGIGADVGALSGVCASMSGERAAVAKLFATGLTLMRLLTGVDAFVDCQGGPLDELLAAYIARMRSVAGVDAF